ncbi:MAG: pilus assembly protein PilY [Thermodesulfovibrio aggregans]|uniref:Pilus assembly protein PilY n=1 Tax=Thermodesulfovibrio aggregans TaxID=86166 RepID=A0A2J6WN64_9BACT|nr:MAG: pilus assembly protein PilY [Thermodesulfovibrio aggregans]
MRKLFLFVFLFLICLLIKDNPAVQSTSIDMGNYCYSPPSIAQSASPNVLFVIDVSGSMSWCAYNPNASKRECCLNSSGCGWTYNGNEEGYFSPDKIYQYNSSTGYWQETTGTASTCPNRSNDISTSKKYQGACLNFLYMKRVDLVRWAITGGRLDSCTSNDPKRCDPELYGQPSAQLSCDSYGCVLKSESGQRVKVPWQRITDSLTFQFRNLSLQPRLGVMFYSDTGVRSNKVYIGDFTGSSNFDSVNPYKNLIAAINYESPSGSTPTAPALWDAYNYFAQNTPEYGGFTPQQGAGDKWRNPMYQCFDENNNGVCEGSELKLVACAKNFVILLTDGQWNYGGKPVTRTCSINTGYERNSADPVVPAYWLHKKGFTNSKTNIFSYVEAIYGIGLWLGGTGEKSLKQVAMYGSFNRSKQWPDGLSDYPKSYCGPIDDCCDDSNCGRGSSCANLPPSSSDWDKDGDGKPDTFYSASNAIEIKEAIKNALFDILRRASSGSTVATLASRTGISSLVIQPYFYPKYQRDDGTELSWLGFLRSFWVDLKQNLREDSVVNKILDMAQNTWDKIIQFIKVQDETKIAVLVGDTDSGNNACQLEDIKDLNQVKAVFDSGCQLAQNSASVRTIKYNKDGTLTNFNTSEASYLASIWQTVDSTIDSTKAGCIIRYLRGEDLSNDSTCKSLPYVQRPRELKISSFCNANLTATWKLGDIINSTPSVVSDQPVNIYHIKYGDSSYAEFIRNNSYRNRPTIAFVGANDGMLHAFRVGTAVNQRDPEHPTKIQNAPNDTGTDKIGQEEWAFIPKNAIPYLIWYGKSDYCHVPTVDYRTIVVDAKINGQWRTLLVGAMGFGGKAIPQTNPQYSSSVFVLDITDPTSPQLVWESRLPDNTLTLSFPAVLKADDWYLVIGSGPNDPKGESSSTAKIYFFRLADGYLTKTLTVKDGNQTVTAAVGDIMPVDFDFDYSDDVLYFGTYTTNSGNFYRIYLKGKTVSGLSDSDITKAVSVSRPVFAAANFTVDEFGKLWVFFGTGRYLNNTDKTISYTNYFIGFKDECKESGCSYILGSSGMANTTSTQIQATVTEVKKICSCDSSGCSQVDVVYDTTAVTTAVEPEHGWYYQLPGEAIISQPAVFGGNVDVLVFAPPQDICAYGGNTELMALYYKTGTPNPRPAVLSSLATSGTQGTVTVYAKIPIGSGAPPFGNPFQITQGTSSKEYTKFVQVSTGAVLRIGQQVAQGYESRFISWIEK